MLYDIPYFTRPYNAKLRGWATINKPMIKIKTFDSDMPLQKRHGFAQFLSSALFAVLHLYCFHGFFA
jgi:hypothetical protein